MDIETQAARQAHYIKWAELHDIHDPCGPQEGWQRVVTIYIEYVILGINYTNKTGVRAATIRGYAESVNTLFVLRGFQPPADFDDPNNMVTILASNLKKEEDVAHQRSLLDNHIFAKLQAMATKSKSQDSAESVFLNTVALGRITGHRLSEYAQNKQNKVKWHEYPSGKRVIKAFTANDFTFFDSSRMRITDLAKANLSQVASMKVTWHIQYSEESSERTSPEYRGGCQESRHLSRSECSCAGDPCKSTWAAEGNASRLLYE